MKHLGTVITTLQTLNPRNAPRGASGPARGSTEAADCRRHDWWFLDGCQMLTLEMRQACPFCLLQYISILPCSFCLELSLKPCIWKEKRWEHFNPHISEKTHGNVLWLNFIGLFNWFLPGLISKIMRINVKFVDAVVRYLLKKEERDVLHYSTGENQTQNAKAAIVENMPKITENKNQSTVFSISLLYNIPRIMFLFVLLLWGYEALWVSRELCKVTLERNELTRPLELLWSLLQATGYISCY